MEAHEVLWRLGSQFFLGSRLRDDPYAQNVVYPEAELAPQRLLLAYHRHIPVFIEVDSIAEVVLYREIARVTHTHTQETATFDSFRNVGVPNIETLLENITLKCLTWEFPCTVKNHLLRYANVTSDLCDTLCWKYSPWLEMNWGIQFMGLLTVTFLPFLHQKWRLYCVN